MVTKKVLIGSAITGTTLVSIFIAMQLFGLIITSDGDKFCNTNCESIIDVYNPTINTVSIYNREGKIVTFSPEIRDFQLYKQSGTKWIQVNLTKKSNYALLTFKPYTHTKLKLVGQKDITQQVKWSINSDEKELLDPTWYSVYYYTYRNGTTYGVNGSVIIKENSTIEHKCNITIPNCTVWNETIYWNYSSPTYGNISYPIEIIGLHVNVFPPNQTYDFVLDDEMMYVNNETSPNQLIVKYCGRAYCDSKYYPFPQERYPTSCRGGEVCAIYDLKNNLKPIVNQIDADKKEAKTKPKALINEI